MTITEVDTEGNIHIPGEFGIKPKEKVIVNKVEDVIIIQRPQQEVAMRIKEISRDILKDVEWDEIKTSRRDREWP